MSRLKPAYQNKSFDTVPFASLRALGIRHTVPILARPFDTPCPLDRGLTPGPRASYSQISTP